MHALFFDMEPKAGHMPHYFEHVDRLRPLLAAHEGLLYLERFRPLDQPDAILSHQHWAGEEAIRAWRCDGTHRASQAAGRNVHFERYRIRVGPEVVPEGANQIASVASPVPVIDTEAPPFAEIEVVNTVFCEAGASVSTVIVNEPLSDQLPASLRS